MKTKNVHAVFTARQAPLTPALLRTFPSFAHLSQSEAEALCHTSLLFARLLLETVAQRSTTFIDNQDVVYSTGENSTPVVPLHDLSSLPNKTKAA